MRKWLAVLFFLGAFAFPFSANAQAPSSLKLTSLQVQLWPEYDQPSMLVICDFKLPAATALPVTINYPIPTGANLVAVATQSADGNLLNTEYAGPTTNGDWQIVSVKVQTQSTYHIEYYQPLTKNGNTRQFTYVWPGAYAVEDFKMNIRIPVDTTNITTDPIMDTSQSSDGTSYLVKDFSSLNANQQFTLKVNYIKTSNALSAQQTVKPSEPLGPNTEGRVMLSNYLPYFLGGVGIVLIVGGLVYFWQSNRGRKSGNRKRHVKAEVKEAASDVYCHQCGTRAHSGDRFCRVCGTKLRLGE